jgi:hypothetical protein
MSQYAAMASFKFLLIHKKIFYCVARPLCLAKRYNFFKLCVLTQSYIHNRSLFDHENVGRTVLVFYLTTLSITQTNITSNDWIIVNSKLEWMSKEAFVA